jgi:hypothetical protein
VRPLFTADYYPLTEWSEDPMRWLAFEFYDPGKGEGIVQAFCGAAAASRTFNVRLKGLDPGRSYAMTDWDDPSRSMERSGADLADTGIEIRAKDGRQQAIVLHFRDRLMHSGTRKLP